MCNITPKGQSLNLIRYPYKALQFLEVVFLFCFVLFCFRSKMSKLWEFISYFVLQIVIYDQIAWTKYSVQISALKHEPKQAK